MNSRQTTDDATQLHQSASPVTQTTSPIADAAANGEQDDVGALVRAALARDFELLAVLNDSEPTVRLLASLSSTPAADWFAFKAVKELAVGACDLLDAALDAMPNPVCLATLDQLAADFAAIYLIHSYRAPPTESPWLDKDQLERQEPMFEVAAWYRRFGLAAKDRQLRSDDHLVLQLQFLSHLFSTPELNMAESAAEAARFMDQHLLRWIGDFAERVAARCETPYYCGLATLTHGYLESVRDHLAEHYGQERASPPEAQASSNARVAKAGEELGSDRDEGEELAMRYMPGAAPSW